MSLSSVEKICHALSSGVDDVLEFISDEKRKKTMIKRCVDVSKLEARIKANPFLSLIYQGYVCSGQVFLAFRNNEATFYYHGKQLCNMRDSKNFDPTINKAFLPLRTIISGGSQYISEKEWQENTNLSCGYSTVLVEILENIEHRQDPESLQVSYLYKFSPLCNQCSSDIILLDIEAAFAESGVPDRDRIDVVMYDKIRQQLLFAEIKRLSDVRLQEGGKLQSEIVTQMDGYRNILDKEKPTIIEQYNRVIEYYSQLAQTAIPSINAKKDILLGLWITEYIRDDSSCVKDLRKQIGTKFPVADIGQMSSLTAASLEKVCKLFSK